MGPWLKLAISAVSGGLAIEQMAGDTRLQCQGLEYLTDRGGGVLVWHWKIVPRLEGPWEEQISESWMHALPPPPNPNPLFFFFVFFLKIVAGFGFLGHCCLHKYAECVAGNCSPVIFGHNHPQLIRHWISASFLHCQSLATFSVWGHWQSHCGRHMQSC